MKNSKLIWWGFLQALGVAVYVTLVGLFMQNGEKFFGQAKSIFIPMAFLMLFVLSAAITGSLVLGRPVLMYLENKKVEAIKLFGFTLGWMFLIILIILSSQALLK